TGNAIALTGSSATNAVIAGNFIGTNAAGTAAIGNTTGVRLQGGAHDNTVGGTAIGAGNLISGNSADGIVISDAGTSNNFVLGNSIGADATGTIDLGNGLAGVGVTAGASGNYIGGTVARAGNLISGNDHYGVAIRGDGTGNSIRGN